MNNIAILEVEYLDGSMRQFNGVRFATKVGERNPIVFNPMECTLTFENNADDILSTGPVRVWGLEHYV